MDASEKKPIKKLQLVKEPVKRLAVRSGVKTGERNRSGNWSAGSGSASCSLTDTSGTGSLSGILTTQQ